MVVTFLLSIKVKRAFFDNYKRQNWLKEWKKEKLLVSRYRKNIRKANNEPIIANIIYFQSFYFLYDLFRVPASHNISFSRLQNIFQCFIVCKMIEFVRRQCDQAENCTSMNYF